MSNLDRALIHPAEPMMQSGIVPDPTPDRESAQPRANKERRPYVAPIVEDLGRLSARTLQQSVPIAFDRVHPSASPSAYGGHGGVRKPQPPRHGDW